MTTLKFFELVSTMRDKQRNIFVPATRMRSLLQKDSKDRWTTR